MIVCHVRHRFLREHEAMIEEWTRKIGAMGPYLRLAVTVTPEPPSIKLGLTVITHATLHAERQRNNDLVINPASRADAALIDQWCREQEARDDDSLALCDPRKPGHATCDA